MSVINVGASGIGGTRRRALNPPSATVTATTSGTWTQTVSVNEHGTYDVWQCTATGNWTPSRDVTVNILLVGGGAAGAGWGGGGGGGGGYLEGATRLLAGVALTATIGAGGAAVNRGGSNGNATTLTVASGITWTALPGGSGGVYVTRDAPYVGGSGGGGRQSSSVAAMPGGLSALYDAGVNVIFTNQGGRGGDGEARGDGWSGAGGGASRVQPATPVNAGTYIIPGGAGRAWFVNNVVYAGGGGNDAGGAGGAGGGGAGAVLGGTAATANTGGGGGGSLADGYLGGAGGSGTVLIAVLRGQ